jgi:transposase
VAHDDPLDPPRRRANKRRGHGTFASDRPPIAGVVGRASGQVRLRVVGNADRATLEEGVEGATLEGTTVYTDEWCGYGRLGAMGRGHATVCHAAGEWARDDDGDGVREVHDNTLEGLWTGLRNFLRTFRGVSKWYLAQYVAIFQWSYNLKCVTDGFLRCLLGVANSTSLDS